MTSSREHTALPWTVSGPSPGGYYLLKDDRGEIIARVDRSTDAHRVVREFSALTSQVEALREVCETLQVIESDGLVSLRVGVRTVVSWDHEEPEAVALRHLGLALRYALSKAGSK